MKKRFTDEQIIGFLREAEAGLSVKALCRQHGFFEASYYPWRGKFKNPAVVDDATHEAVAIVLERAIDGHVLTRSLLRGLVPLFAGYDAPGREEGFGVRPSCFEGRFRVSAKHLPFVFKPLVEGVDYPRGLRHVGSFEIELYGFLTVMVLEVVRDGTLVVQRVPTGVAVLQGDDERASA